jgi:hypothetical protein
MLELDVTALLGNFPPSIGFHDAKHIVAVHVYKYTLISHSSTLGVPLRIVGAQRIDVEIDNLDASLRLGMPGAAMPWAVA